jgi:hypothetical protein
VCINHSLQPCLHLRVQFHSAVCHVYAVRVARVVFLAREPRTRRKHHTSLWGYNKMGCSVLRLSKNP